MMGKRSIGHEEGAPKPFIFATAEKVKCILRLSIQIDTRKKDSDSFWVFAKTRDDFSNSSQNFPVGDVKLFPFNMSSFVSKTITGFLADGFMI